MNPSEKISIIERSLRCRFLGYLSLIPIIGLITAVFALVDFRFVRGMVATEWNPARRQLNWGITLAIIGVTISTIILCVVLISILYGVPANTEYGYGAEYGE